MGNKKSLIVWGGTGQSVVLEEFLSGQDYIIEAIVDNNENCQSPFNDIPVLHGMSGLDQFLENNLDKNFHCVVAIGGKHGKDRFEIQRSLANKGLKVVTSIHPHSFIAKNATIGEGSQILANSSVCARATIGDACIINTNASVDHECKIGNGVHIGPGANLAGCITVGDYSFIGTGATILPWITIGKNVIVGAGAVVTKNIPDNCTVVGIPAKIK